MYEDVYNRILRGKKETKRHKIGKKLNHWLSTRVPAPPFYGGRTYIRIFPEGKRKETKYMCSLKRILEITNSFIVL